jgi:hypothetical protein
VNNDEHFDRNFFTLQANDKISPQRNNILVQKKQWEALLSLLLAVAVLMLLETTGQGREFLRRLPAVPFWTDLGLK